jgi:hypothetical protein
MQRLTGAQTLELQLVANISSTQRIKFASRLRACNDGNSLLASEKEIKKVRCDTKNLMNIDVYPDVTPRKEKLIPLSSTFPGIVPVKCYKLFTNINIHMYFLYSAYKHLISLVDFYFMLNIHMLLMFTATTSLYYPGAIRKLAGFTSIVSHFSVFICRD